MKIYDECDGCREVGSSSTAISDSYNPLSLDAGVSMSRGKLAERLNHFDLDPEAICSVKKAEKLHHEYSPR